MNFNFGEEKIRLTDGVILRYLRTSHRPKKLTTRELSTLMDCANSLISHWEWGRNPMPESRIHQACSIFNITRADWDLYSNGDKQVPINYKDECLLLLQKIDDSLLPPIYSMINAMVQQSLNSKKSGGHK